MPTSERPTNSKDVTIETVDRAVKRFFDRTVDAHVESPSSDRKKVPVVIASGERWVAAKDRRGIRDSAGRIILPVLSLRRTGIDVTTNMSSMGVNTQRVVLSRKVSQKTSLIRNALDDRPVGLRGPSHASVYDVTTIPFPRLLALDYELVVQTQFIGQMNDVVQKITSCLYTTAPVPSFVMPVDDDGYRPGNPRAEGLSVDGYYFVGFIDQLTDSSNFEEFTDQERIVKYSFNFRVPTYLQLDEEGNRPAHQVERTPSEAEFFDEAVTFVDDPYEIEAVFGPRR